MNGADNGNGVRITNREIWTKLEHVEAQLSDLRVVLGDYPEVKSRVRGLELRYLAILGGLLSSAVVAAIVKLVLA